MSIQDLFKGKKSKATDPMRHLMMGTATIVGMKVIDKAMENYKSDGTKSEDSKDWALRYSDIEDMIVEASKETMVFLIFLAA